MIFLSDEDVDVKRLLARWIKAQPEGLRGGLSGWVDDMFYRYPLPLVYSYSSWVRVPFYAIFQKLWTLMFYVGFNIGASRKFSVDNLEASVAVTRQQLPTAH